MNRTQRTRRQWKAVFALLTIAALLAAAIVLIRGIFPSSVVLGSLAIAGAVYCFVVALFMTARQVSTREERVLLIIMGLGSLAIGISRFTDDMNWASFTLFSAGWVAVLFASIKYSWNRPTVDPSGQAKRG